MRAYSINPSTMKKFFFLILFFLPILCFAQSDRQLDSLGHLQYQYSRTFAQNPQDASELIVTFIFVNGNQQQAITLRQEKSNTAPRWLSTQGGTLTHETIVDAVTANLAPNQSVVWKYAVKTTNGKPETAALMLMSDKYVVDKIMLK